MAVLYKDQPSLIIHRVSHVTTILSLRLCADSVIDRHQARRPRVSQTYVATYRGNSPLQHSFSVSLGYAKFFFEKNRHIGLKSWLCG